MSPLTVSKSVAEQPQAPGYYEVASPLKERFTENLESLFTGVVKGDFRDNVVRNGLNKLAARAHFSRLEEASRPVAYETEPEELTFDEIVLLGSTLADSQTVFVDDATQEDLYENFAKYCSRKEVYGILSYGFEESAYHLSANPDVNAPWRARQLAVQRIEALSATLGLLTKVSFDYPEVAENVFALCGNYVKSLRFNPKLVSKEKYEEFLIQKDLAFRHAGEVFHILSSFENPNSIIDDTFLRLVQTYLVFRKRTGIDFITELISNKNFNFGRKSYRQVDLEDPRSVFRESDRHRIIRIRDLIRRSIKGMSLRPSDKQILYLALFKSVEI